MCWNSAWRDLRHFESTESGSEVNLLIDGVCGERLPTVDFPHVDLPWGEQRPEQHRSSIGRRQHGLGFDPSLELLVQTVDRVRGPCAAPLGRWQASESEEAVASFLQAVRDGAMTKPPLADESVAARRDLLGRGRVVMSV
jgi:hypothetical protein